MPIVVAHDPSPSGEAALAAAQEEARLRHEELVLVGNVPLPQHAEDRPSYAEQQERVDRAVRSRAEQLRADGLDCRPYVASAPMDRGRAVLTALQEVGGTLAVVGVRERSPVGKALLGSAEQDILLGADCTVLAVKADAG